MSSHPDGWIKEYLSDESETDAGRPVIETITTHRTYTTHTTPETGEGDTDIVYRSPSQIPLSVRNARNEIHAQRDHFRVPLSLCFRASLSAKFLLW